MEIRQGSYSLRVGKDQDFQAIGPKLRNQYRETHEKKQEWKQTGTDWEVTKSTGKSLYYHWWRRTTLGFTCVTTQTYIEKGCQVYLAQVTSKKADDKLEERRLEDVLIVRNFRKSSRRPLLDYQPARQA
ncbi:hypothetical protein Tco_0850008 [Tanacetum coccineum]